MEAAAGRPAQRCRRAGGGAPEQLYRSLAGAGWLATRQAGLAWAVARRIRLRWWAAAALIVAAGAGIAVFAIPVALRWLPWLAAAAGALGALAVPAAPTWKKIRAARACRVPKRGIGG